MLSVVALNGGRAHYYLSLASVSYYTERAAEPAGLWYGEGARALGLSGVVEREALTNLCDGFSVDGSQKLVRNAGRTEGRAPRKYGEDFTFNVPKSVSVAWALAPEDVRKDIQKAVLMAVRDTLDYIQENLAFARVKAQGQELVRAPLTFGAVKK
jgi:conjugative relaxase-like TrwC/TraI family protein